MSEIYEAKEEMHSIEAQLYPNHLQNDGTYVAKNVKEKTIGIEAVCAAMKNRGGYDGGVDEAVKTVKHFLKEVMYQLCDGFSINLLWFTITVSFSGLFHSVNEPFAPPKHKVTFKFHPLKAMRKLTDLIEVTVNGRIEEPAYISEFIDLEEDLTNSLIVAGHGFAVHGHNIKIEGDDPCGMYFVPVDDPSKKVKVERLLENNPSKITAIAPVVDNAVFRVEIVTKFSSSSTVLLTPRTITSPFTIEDI